MKKFFNKKISIVLIILFLLIPIFVGAQWGWGSLWFVDGTDMKPVDSTWGIDLGSGDFITTGTGTFGTTFQAVLGSTALATSGVFTDGTSGVQICDNTGNAIIATAGNILLQGDDIKLGLGEAGTTDSYIQFGGANLEYYSSGEHDFLAGNITTSGSFTTTSSDIVIDNDGTGIIFGNGQDYIIGYNNTGDQLEICDGASIGSNTRLTMDSSGNFNFQAGNITTTGAISSTIADEANKVPLTIAQNDVTNNPKGITLANAGTSNAFHITQTGNISASRSVGGALLITNTSNSGNGMVVYSNHAGSATGRLVHITADNVAFDKEALFVESDSTSVTAFSVSGAATTQGTVKIEHTGTGTDGNASALSIDLAGTGTAAQGIFIDATGGGTTGNILNLRNDGNEMFVLDASGNVTVTGTGTFGGATDTIQFTVKANASQTFTNPIFTMQDSSANDLMFFTTKPSAGGWAGAIEWIGGSKLFEQRASPEGSDRMLYLPNGDRFEVLNEAGSAFLFSVHGANSSQGTKNVSHTNFEIGGGGGANYTLGFNTSTNDGLITWMKAEDYFQFSDDILMLTAEKINFRDTAIGIYSQADTFMDLFADGGVRIGDSSAGAPTNYIQFAPDGELTLAGTARVYKNMELTPANVGKPSANPPDSGEYQGFQFDRFDRGTEEQVYYLWHVPDDFATGDTSVHGHFGFFVENPPSGTDEAVVLGFEYKKISPNDTFDFSSGTTSGIITTTIADGEAAYKWHETTSGICTTTGWAAGDIILFRFYRDATNANDTYDNEATAANNDVWVGIYHLQYLSDKLGQAL